MEDGAELIAAFDPETGAFVDLVLSDSQGLSFRDRGDWHSYQPADTSLDGQEIIEVESSFADFVDRAQAGRGQITRNDALKHSAGEAA